MIALLTLLACRADPRPDLILVTWDTTRADRVRLEPGNPLTPTAARLAAEGVRFTQARTPCPVTLPAHASMLSGVGPPGHGARLNGSAELRPDLPLLQEHLAAAGWHTGAFVSASVLRGRYGLSRGFDRYDDEVIGASADGTPSWERRGEQTLARAEAWIAEQPRGAPLFLWLHLYDPHQPWVAPEPWASAHADPYDAEIAYADALTARLLEALERRGRLERSALVLTSDHGEGLGDHGEATHGYFVYDSTAHVPLILWAGESLGADWRRGAAEAQPVGLIDLAPTLAELAGLDWQAEGRSLAPALTRADALSPSAYALETLIPWSFVGAAPVFGALDEDLQLRVDLPQRERYDLRADPAQLENLYQEADAARFEAALARFPRSWPPQPQGELDAETTHMLAALGYVSAAEAVPLGDEALDPKQLTGLFEHVTDHREALTAVPPERRVALLRLLAPGQHPIDEALPLIEAWQAPPPALQLRRVALYDALGDLAAATEALAPLAVEAPEFAADLAARQDALAARGALLARIQAHLESAPGDTNARYDLGVTALALGELELARASLEAALAAAPADTQAHLALVKALLRLGEGEQARRLLAEAPPDCALEGFAVEWLLLPPPSPSACP